MQFHLSLLLAHVAVLAVALTVGTNAGLANGICLWFYLAAALHAMRDFSSFKNNFTRWHGPIVVATWLVVGCLGFLTMLEAAEDYEPQSHGVPLLCLAGPFSAPLARNFQPCCLKASLDAAPWFAIPIGAALLLHAVTKTDATWLDTTRFTVWLVAWLAWFFSGLFLLIGHAWS